MKTVRPGFLLKKVYGMNARNVILVPSHSLVRFHHLKTGQFAGIRTEKVQFS